MPLVPAALLTAAKGSLTDHVTRDVTSIVVLFEYVAVAVNCCVSPRGTEGASGVI